MGMIPMEYEGDKPNFVLGERVNVAGYTSDSNRYTALNDGYLYVRGHSTSPLTIMMNYGYQSVPANSYVTMWVRKGAEFYLTGTPQQATFYPDIS